MLPVTEPAAQLYTYTATHITGASVQGTLRATSLTLARAALCAQGLYHIQCRPFLSMYARLQLKQQHRQTLGTISRQWATLVSAGVPLAQSLMILELGTKQVVLKKMLGAIRHGLESGHSVTDSLAPFSDYFDPFFRGLVACGERSGTLDVILLRLATYAERRESLRRQRNQALIYPAVVVALSIAVSVLMVTVIVPQFEVLYRSYDTELPAYTRAVIQLAQAVPLWLGPVLCLAVILTLLVYTLKRRYPAFALKYDRCLLRLPIYGAFHQTAMTAHMARTLGLCYRAGLPLTEAIEALIPTLTHSTHRIAFTQVHAQVSMGAPVHEAMRATQQFPELVVQLIAVGEASGTLERMLDAVAQRYEESLELLVKKLSTLLEPAILVILGVSIGGLVIALYLPIIHMGSLF